MSGAPLSAFEGIGIELEAMIVDSQDLTVRPLAESLLQQDGQPSDTVVRGPLAWSNEFVQHVIEVKNLAPSPSPAGLIQAFQSEIAEIERRMAPHGARLMPGAMHPWMDPRRETRLWTRGDDAIYRAYDRIFDCRSHGWANLQSMHVNLPFAGDAQFTRLLCAIRIVLPILPALAASSPLVEGRPSGWMDTRMHMYAGNAPGFPEITGTIVPENVTSRAAYTTLILQPMYRAIAAHDPQRMLQHEWLNSRGAIARFSRNAIEIRVIDTQECVGADLAIAAATAAAVRSLYEADTLEAQQDIPTRTLANILHACIRDGERAHLDEPAYLRLLGIGRACSAGDLWQRWLERLPGIETVHHAPLQTIVEHGPLARRILLAVNGDYSRRNLETVYRALCDCLREGRVFVP